MSLPNEFFSRVDRRMAFYEKRAERRRVKLAPRHLKRLKSNVITVVFDKMGIEPTLDNLFQAYYVPAIESLIPAGVTLLNKISKDPGTKYHQPVILGFEGTHMILDKDEDI